MYTLIRKVDFEVYKISVKIQTYVDKSKIATSTLRIAMSHLNMFTILLSRALFLRDYVGLLCSLLHSVLEKQYM